MTFVSRSEVQVCEGTRVRISNLALWIRTLMDFATLRFWPTVPGGRLQQL